MTSPTVSNCTNEPQIESKEKMRQRMAKVSLALKGSPKVRTSIIIHLFPLKIQFFQYCHPKKVVSPKRTLGSGPVLVGKLETVAEKELETTQLETSLSNSGRDSIQTNSVHSGHSRNKSLNTSLNISQTNSHVNNQSAVSKSPAGSMPATSSINNSLNTSHLHETSLQSAGTEFQSAEKQTGNQTQAEDQQFVVMRTKQPNQKVSVKNKLISIK